MFLKNKTAVFAVVLLAVIAGAYFGWQDIFSPAPAEKPGLIKAANPPPNQKITSPLLISGEARGYWFFEASFPAKLLDEDGSLLAIMPVQAQGEWMTENFVPFRAELVFLKPKGNRGTLILEKDNPSGLPEHADELRIPVRF